MSSLANWILACMCVSVCACVHAYVQIAQTKNTTAITTKAALIIPKGSPYRTIWIQHSKGTAGLTTSLLCWFLFSLSLLLRVRLILPFLVYLLLGGPLGSKLSELKNCWFTIFLLRVVRANARVMWARSTDWWLLTQIALQTCVFEKNKISLKKQKPSEWVLLLCNTPTFISPVIILTNVNIERLGVPIFIVYYQHQTGH